MRNVKPSFPILHKQFLSCMYAPMPSLEQTLIVLLYCTPPFINITPLITMPFLTSTMKSDLGPTPSLTDYSTTNKLPQSSLPNFSRPGLTQIQHPQAWRTCPWLLLGSKVSSVVAKNKSRSAVGINRVMETGTN